MTVARANSRTPRARKAHLVGHGRCHVAGAAGDTMYRPPHNLLSGNSRDVHGENDRTEIDGVVQDGQGEDLHTRNRAVWTYVGQGVSDTGENECDRYH